jgi:(2Fe-2S) ferredoxin
VLDQQHIVNPTPSPERSGEGFYTHHIILCNNVRGSKTRCCGGGQSRELIEFARRKIKRLRRITHIHLGLTVSGCLGRCGEGPCLVIYPSSIWCRFDSREDIDEIFEAFAGDKPVPRRLIINNVAAGKS